MVRYPCCKIFWSHIHECQEQLCASRKTWPVLQATQGISCFVCVALTQLPSSGACPLRALHHSVPCNFLWWGIAHTYAQGVKGQITLDTTSHNRLLYPFVYWQALATSLLNVILKQLEFLLTLYKRVSHKPGCISKSWAQVVALEQVCMWVMLFKCAWGITPPTTGVSQWSDCEVQVWSWCGLCVCKFALLYARHCSEAVVICLLQWQMCGMSPG